MVLVHIFKEAVENAPNLVQGSTGSTLESSVGRNANTELSLTYLGKFAEKCSYYLLHKQGNVSLISASLVCLCRLFAV